MGAPAQHAAEASSDVEASTSTADPLLSSMAEPAATPDLDVRDLQRILVERVGPSPAPDTATPLRKTVRRWDPRWRRAGKVALGLGVVGVFGIVPVRTLLQVSSVEAVVNARVVTLRSPIAGQIVSAPPEPSATAILPRGAAIFDVVDRLADPGRLDELTQRMERLTSHRDATQARLVSSQVARTELARRAEAYRLGRVEHLTANIAELRSEAAVTSARGAEAVADHDRAATLARSGSLSPVQLNHIARLAVIATETTTATQARLRAAEVELASARGGILLADVNDLPTSVLRDDELRRQISDLGAELATTEAELGQARQQVARERTRFQGLSSAAISLPVAGRIWEMMVTAGEQVSVGQDLVKVIDCSTSVVTANVTESVYNQLALGSAARFIPADGGPELAGRVVQLSGLATAGANLAIEPAALRKEPYRVAVSLPATDGSQGCAVGRTGRVVFNGPGSASR